VRCFPQKQSYLQPGPSWAAAGDILPGKFGCFRKKGYLCRREKIKLSIMEAMIARESSRRRKKLTPQERKTINAAKPAGNKYVEAARRHQGEVWVKDPMLLL